MMERETAGYSKKKREKEGKDKIARANKENKDIDKQRARGRVRKVVVFLLKPVEYYYHS